MQNMTLLTNKYGQHIWSEPESHIAHAIKTKGVYDDQAITCIEQLLKQMPQAVVLDIGAHIGNHAMVMSQFCKMVYCFEPLPENVATLKQNQTANQIQNIEIFNVGLSNQNETLTFYQDGSTFVADLQHHGSKTQTLQCRVGDEVIKEIGIHHIDFIKIDIEGFEPQALYGLRHTIMQSRPIVLMEWNNDATREAFNQFNLFQTVFKDYQCRAIAHNHHRYYFGNCWYSALARFFYRKIIRKRRMLIPFLVEGDYTNVLLIPNEKMGLMPSITFS